MEYQLRKDSVEAWQIGTEPVPDWAVEMVADRTIVDIGGTFSVSTANDRERAQLGDYITYQPSVTSEPSEEFPQGEVLAVREVSVFKRADFEALYEVPTAHVDEPVVPESEPQPFAADPEAATAFEAEKPRRRR
jgi:hypothetical protein